ncbi:lysine transporter LysE [Corynebacterium phocae]|uniref:Lysine transporter LysE n=1 Tax=Corynebacterium phocae TaxID=161895 RepID=A0A1L7D1S9_9CORY|nr:LysE family translocator [Corynebacterium phocae]APT92089.1 lysine transporter LysE [Corynebacterium phocae]KAA8726473.1 LysE family translocator [Corynebacterium phocae]
MTFSAFLTIIFANLLGAASPGPDVILITRLATKSRRHALAAVFGIITGVTMWVTLTVLGAAALLTAFPSLLGIIQVVGGCLLVYMGYQTVRGGLAARGAVPADLAQAEAMLGRLRGAYYQGLATNLANPKIVLFLSALIAPLLPPSPSLGVALTLIAAMVLSCLAMFVLMSFVISTARVRRKMLAVGPLIDILAGSFFMLAGTGLIISGLRDVLT